MVQHTEHDAAAAGRKFNPRQTGRLHACAREVREQRNRLEQALAWALDKPQSQRTGCVSTTFLPPWLLCLQCRHADGISSVLV